MKIITQIVLGIASCLLGVSTYVTAATEQTATYKNQRNSTLIMVWHHDTADTGTLTGTFTTAVGNCKTDIGVPVPIAGFFNGNAVGITINFPHCQQVVAMTGNFINHDTDKLRTLWLDATNVKDPVNENWNSNVIGTDLYKKVIHLTHEQ